ncbi:MAG: hypothetical protein HY675_11190 [Chloroflexi bacterium]|nr:hypothetical protein [Chloroflexota bacterium]
MAEPLDTAIREHLSRYIDGKISHREFHRWLVPRVWNVHKLGNLDLENLVGEIHLRLAEFANGDWTEDELKDLLRPLVDTYYVNMNMPTRILSSSRVIHRQISYPAPVVAYRVIPVDT